MRLNPNLTPAQYVQLLWGKFRRYYLITFRREYVNASLARRVGSCDRVGACCKLLYTCPFLDESSGEPRCRNYDRRPSNCRIFPIDERDIAERDLVSPCRSCGFTFLPAQPPRRDAVAHADTPYRIAV